MHVQQNINNFLFSKIVGFHFMELREFFFVVYWLQKMDFERETC